jgi:hypothetical protein
MSRDEQYEERTSSERLSTDQSGRRLSGLAIPFNRTSHVISDERIGRFREMILPQAVDRVLSTGREVKALWNHDQSEVLGSRTAGTLTLNKTARGLLIEIDPPKWAGHYVETVERGDVNRMSFGFKVVEGGEEWDFRTGDGLPLHTVSDMVFREISITAFPAYDDTSVQVSQRSIDLFLECQSRVPYQWRAKFAELMKP